METLPTTDEQPELRPTPPAISPAGRIDIAGQVYREGGMWKIRLIVPEWVMYDIERDIDEHRLSGVIVEAEHSYVNVPGQSMYNPVPKAHWYMFGMIRFEWSLEK